MALTKVKGSVKFEETFPLYVMTGQSNAKGNNTGGDTTVNSNVKAWNGSAFVIGELTVSPFEATGENNIGLQALREIANNTEDNSTQYMVQSAQGGLPISNWLPGAPTTDMYADIKTKVEAALTNLGKPLTTPIRAVIWMQGESDDSDTGFFGYSANLAAVIDRFKAETWWSNHTKFIVCMLAHNINGDRANIGIRDLATSGDYLELSVVDSEFQATDDGTHFTGASLTEIGKRVAQTIDGYRQYLPKRIIDRQVNVDVGTGGDFLNLEKAMEYFSDWSFSSRGELILNLVSDIVITSSPTAETNEQKTQLWYTAWGSHILIKGVRTGNVPVAGDFVGTEATDKTMAEGRYTYKIDCSGTAFQLASSTLRMQDVLIVGDSTASAMGIDMVDGLTKTGGSNLVLQDCTIIGFDSHAIKMGKDDSVSEHSPSTAPNNHSCLAWCKQGVNSDGGSINLPYSQIVYHSQNGVFAFGQTLFDLDNATIDNNTLEGVSVDEVSQGTLENATVTNSGATNDLKVRAMSKAIVTGATITVMSPALDTDNGGDSVCCNWTLP